MADNRKAVLEDEKLTQFVGDQRKLKLEFLALRLLGSGPQTEDTTICSFQDSG